MDLSFLLLLLCAAASSAGAAAVHGGDDPPSPFPLYYTCYLYRIIDDDVRVLVDLARCEDESPYCAFLCPAADASAPPPRPLDPHSILPSGDILHPSPTAAAGDDDADDMICYIVQMYDISHYDSFFVDCSLIGRCSLGCSSQPPPLPPPHQRTDLGGSRFSEAAAASEAAMAEEEAEDGGVFEGDWARSGEYATELLLDEI